MNNGFGLTTEETIALAQGIQPGPRKATSEKALTSSNYLYGYPLEAPSKKLYFVEDTVRRRIPRILNQTGGTYAHWKRITGINAGKAKAGVAEGALATAMTFSTDEKSMAYKTLNQYTTYTDEARIFGRKFEDVPQLGMLMVLQSLMIQEDRYLIGGNQNALGSPANVTLAGATTTGGLLVSGTAYDVVVSALTIHGWLNSATGHASADAADETAAVMTGSAHINVTPGGSYNSFTVTWDDVPGAFAYNVYISLHSTATPFYSATVFSNTATILANKTSGNVANTADQTADTYGYSGIVEQLTYGTPAVTGCYYKDMAGSAISTDGAGGVSQIETLLASIWNNYRTSPTVGLINSQEAKSIKKLAIGSSSTNAVRIMVTPDGKNEFGAGSAVNSYWNPYTRQWIELVTSVHIPAGKMLFLGETVPYPNAETPNNFEVELQQEYYGEMFARTSRQTPIGVTDIGALKLYLPGACGIIANCAAA